MSIPSSPLRSSPGPMALSGHLLPAFDGPPPDSQGIHYDQGILTSSPVPKLKTLDRSMVTNGAGVAGDALYPTPLPSSVADPEYQQARLSKASAGIPSSPRHQQVTYAPVSDRLRGFTVRSPLSAVALVRLSRDGTPMTVGRSSRSADVVVSSQNRLVSRVHIRARYNIKTRMVYIDCLGWNGVVVIVPMFPDDDQDSSDVSSRGSTAEGQDEYEVVKGQTICVEYVPGITVDIRGERVLIELIHMDEETEDESHPIPREQLKRANEGANEGENEVETKRIRLQSEPLEPVSAQDKGEDKIEDQGKDAIETPLFEAPAIQVPVEAAAVDEPKEPALSTSSFKHIIANHLAFSRLAQSPISIIRRANSQLALLAEPELRAVITSIECVGTISRSGKDAAGKPLEDEYYYMPERDSDIDRRMLVEQSRGHGLRACRKTHKQYFWKKPSK